MEVYARTLATGLLVAVLADLKAPYALPTPTNAHQIRASAVQPVLTQSVASRVCALPGTLALTATCLLTTANRVLAKTAAFVSTSFLAIRARVRVVGKVHTVKQTLTSVLRRLVRVAVHALIMSVVSLACACPTSLEMIVPQPATTVRRSRVRMAAVARTPLPALSASVLVVLRELYALLTPMNVRASRV